MNIKIKEIPSITIVNCDLYAEQKNALFFVGAFRKDIEHHRNNVKKQINSVAYKNGADIYNVHITASGNIKVKRQFID